MGCAPSADMRKEEALEATQRINDDLAAADVAVAERRVPDAITIVEETRRANVGLLIGNAVPSYTARLSSKLGALRYELEDYRASLHEYQVAARVSLEQAREVREGSYLMVSRYAEASVGCARCHLGLLGEAQTRVEAATQELSEASVRSTTARTVADASASPFGRPIAPSSASSKPPPPAHPFLDEYGGESMYPNPLDTDALSGDPDASPPQPIRSAPPGGIGALVVSDVDFSDNESTLGISVPDNEARLRTDPAERLRLCEKEVRRRIAVTERRLVECVQCIDECHSHRSEMLIEPLTLLGGLYEQLGMWDVAERTVRKLSGVFMVKYGHSHPAYRRTHLWINRLADQSEARAAERAVTRIVSTWKMRKAIVSLAHRLGRDAKGQGERDSASSTDSDGDSARPDEFDAHASLGRAGTPQRAAASPPHKGARHAADFLNVFSRATHAAGDDEEDGDAMLRRQLEAVPKGPATKGTWISAEPEPASRAAALSTSSVTSPVAAGSSGRHVHPDDQAAASPVAVDARSADRRGLKSPPPSFDVVVASCDTYSGAYDDTAQSAPLRPTRAATRARNNGRIVASLVFHMSSGRGAPQAGADPPGEGPAAGKTFPTPNASPSAAPRSRPIGLWEVS